MTLFCAVSDFHMCEIETPPADVLLVAGDMSFQGTFKELAWFEEWLRKQPQTHKIWIAGNHELGLEHHREIGNEIARRTNSRYLVDEVVEVAGITIFGSPFTPRFGDWAFLYDRGSPRWNNKPAADIWMTHGPPYGILDSITPDDEYLGCWDLKNRLLQVKPRYSVFGHIHGGYGRAEELGIKFINASICNESYNAVNSPVLFAI